MQPEVWRPVVACHLDELSVLGITLESSEAEHVAALVLDNVSSRFRTPDDVEQYTLVSKASACSFLPKLTNLTSLSLRSTHPEAQLNGDPGVLHLLLQLPKLRELALSDFADYSPLAALPSLQMLDLTTAQLQSLAALDSLLELPSHVELDLQSESDDRKRLRERAAMTRSQREQSRLAAAADAAETLLLAA